MIKKLISCFTIVVGLCLFTTAIHAKSTSIKISAPISAASGEKVPLWVDISPPLKAGDRLSILSNNNLVVTVTTDGDFKYSRFGTAFKMTKSGKVSARVEKSNGQRYSQQKNITVKKPAKQIKRYINATNGRATIKGKTIRAYIKGYSNRIHLKTKTGSVLIKPTLLISDNIFFKLKGDNDYSNAVVNIPSKSIKLSPYREKPSLSPEADRLLGQALFAGLGWIFGGGNNSTSTSSSSSSNESYVMVNFDSVCGFALCSDKNLSISGGPGSFSPSFSGADAGAIHKGYNGLAGTYKWSAEFDKHGCSGSFRLSGTKKNLTISSHKNCSTTYNEY